MTTESQSETLLERVAVHMYEAAGYLAEADDVMTWGRFCQVDVTGRDEYLAMARAALREVAAYAVEGVPPEGGAQRLDPLVDAAALGVQMFAQHLTEEATR